MTNKWIVGSSEEDHRGGERGCKSERGRGDGEMEGCCRWDGRTPPRDGVE